MSMNRPMMQPSAPIPRPDPSTIKYTPAPYTISAGGGYLGQSTLHPSHIPGVMMPPPSHQQQPFPPVQQFSQPSIAAQPIPNPITVREEETEKGELEKEFLIEDKKLMLNAAEFAALDQQREHARTTLRASLKPSEQCEIKADLLQSSTNIIDENMINIHLMKINKNIDNSNTSKIGIKDRARWLLSEGIQQYLLSIIETTLNGSRTRIQNVQASHNYRTLVDRSSSAVRKINENQSNQIVYKWGPDVRLLLTKEEEKARYLLNKFNEMDAQHLLQENRKQSLARQEILASSGSKRKSEEPTTDNTSKKDVSPFFLPHFFSRINFM
jgi:hypothetical protein